MTIVHGRHRQSEKIHSVNQDISGLVAAPVSKVISLHSGVFHEMVQNGKISTNQVVICIPTYIPGMCATFFEFMY